MLCYIEEINGEVQVVQGSGQVVGSYVICEGKKLYIRKARAEHVQALGELLDASITSATS